MAWLLLRGGSNVPFYLRKLEPEVGVVRWTAERPRAHRFADRGQAKLVQAQVMAREGVPIGLVSDDANARAMAELNQVAEW